MLFDEFCDMAIKKSLDLDDDVELTDEKFTINQDMDKIKKSY